MSGLLQFPAAAEPTPSVGAALAAERPWNVVVLNDSDPTLPAFVAIDRALRASLMAPGRHPVDSFAEALDMLRFPGAQIDNELVALFATKYAAMHVDAVVTFGPGAFEFVERHQSRLWPEARVLYLGIPLELVRDRQLAPTTTGIPIQHDLAGVADLALKLRPATRRLVVISGSGDFDRTMARLARKQLEPYAGRLTIEYWTDASSDEFLRRIAQLQSTDAVLYLAISRDREGRTFVPRELLMRLSVVSPVPIYGPFETFIGHGIVAGAVYGYEAHGKRMGELVHEALSHPAAPIPPVMLGRSSCMADANELRRFGIDENRLPPGCDIRFRQPSLWSEYRWYVLGAVLVVLAQSALILALALQRRRRRRAELDRQAARAELAHAARLASMGELTASIAHEIKQPLSAILAHADTAELLLEADSPPLTEIQRIVAEIRRDDLRASDVITRLRELLGRHAMERQPMDLNEAIRDALHVLDAEAWRRGVTIETELASELPPIIGDRVHLQQVVLNLVLNAMDAVAAIEQGARRITVKTAALWNGVQITVADNGPGIDPAIAARLFESFATTKTRGLGLGLSIARSIVEAHGGKIEAAAGPGGGAVFRIALPGTRRDVDRDAVRAGPASVATR